MYKISDYGIQKHVDNRWYMLVWGDYTQLTAYNREDADAMIKTKIQPNVPLVVYNPDGTIYRAINTQLIPGWDATLRWGVKTPEEARKILEKNEVHEKTRKSLFKLFG